MSEKTSNSDEEVIAEEIFYSSQVSDKMLSIQTDVKSDKFSNSKVKRQEESQSEILEVSGL
jgi:hypothetical protein